MATISDTIQDNSASNSITKSKGKGRAITSSNHSKDAATSSGGNIKQGKQKKQQQQKQAKGQDGPPQIPNKCGLTLYLPCMDAE